MFWFISVKLLLLFLLVLFLVGTISLLNIKFCIFLFIVFNCTSFFFKRNCLGSRGMPMVAWHPKYICSRSKSPGFCTPTAFPIYQNRPVETGKKYRQASLKSTNAGSFVPLDSRITKTLSSLHFVGTSVFSSITGDSKEYHSMLIVLGVNLKYVLYFTFPRENTQKKRQSLLFTR